MNKNKKKTLNTLYFISAILMLTLIGLLYSLVGPQSFSIISSSKVNIGDDGVPYWVIFADGQLQNSKYIFEVPATELESYEDESGKVVPTTNLEISLKRDESVCQYTLLDNDQNWEASVANWFREDRKYYGISAITKTQTFMTVSDNFGNTKKFDALDIGDNVATFTHNGGEVIITSTGGLMSNYECPQLDGYAVQYNEDRQEFENFFTNFDSVDRNRELANEYINGLFTSCDVVQTNNGVKLGLKCVIDDDFVISNPTIKITADARYLDFKFMPTTVGVPEIVEVIKPENVEEGSINAISVKVKNSGKDAGAFKLYAISNAFTFIPTSLSFNLEAGEQETQSFTFVSPDINNDFEFTGEFKLCSISDFTSGQCETEEFKIGVEDVGFIENIVNGNNGNTCGNNVCDANENYATCNLDCSSPELVCDAPNMYKENNKCVCLDGFELTENKDGLSYCKESESNTIILIGIISVILTIIVIMIVVYKRRNK